MTTTAGCDGGPRSASERRNYETSASVNKSESIKELAGALAVAQAANDIHAEARLLKALAPVVTRPGRQHADKPLHQRLLAQIRMGMSECWHWCGSRNGFGYGRMTYQGRLQYAHRLSWMAFRGPVPEGMSVLHRCDNASCINPDHLWIGTYSDNRRDCESKGRWRMHSPKRGFAHHTNKVTPQMLARMRALRDEGLSYKRIAEAVGFNTMGVWNALNKRFCND